MPTLTYVQRRRHFLSNSNNWYMVPNRKQSLRYKRPPDKVSLNVKKHFPKIIDGNPSISENENNILHINLGVKPTQSEEVTSSVMVTMAPDKENLQLRNVTDTSIDTGFEYSSYTPSSTNENTEETVRSQEDQKEESEEVEIVLGAEESMPSTDPHSDAEDTMEPNCVQSVTRTEKPHHKTLPLTRHVRNAWHLARNSFSKKYSSDERTQLTETHRSDEPMANKGDQMHPPSGYLLPWPVAKNMSQPEPKVSQAPDDLQNSTKFVLRQHTENLLQSLKDATLQLARRDMEMQRLITVNSQLGERYCRMRTQYVELAREQARLRQRYDMLLVKSMDREQLRVSNTDLEGQLDELRSRLIVAEERANQSTRRLARCEVEAKEVTHNATNADVQLANLREEMLLKEKQIRALMCRQYMDTAREMQARVILNELIELKGNIRVLVRCHADDDGDRLFSFLNDDTIVVNRPSTNTKSCHGVQSGRGPSFLKAHRVFQPGASQRFIFDEVSELVTSCVDGYSTSILAYGPSGTGKTYTMLGAPNKPGIIPRVARHLVSQCDHRAPLWTYRISLSVIQIYKEHVMDLLAEPTVPTTAQQLGRINLHDNGKQILLRGAKEVGVTTEEDILEHIRQARTRRQASASLLNTSPSYLHFIIIFRVRGLCKLSEFAKDVEELKMHEVHANPLSETEGFLDKSPDIPETTMQKTSHMFSHGLLVLGDLAGFENWSPKRISPGKPKQTTTERATKNNRRSLEHALLVQPKHPHGAAVYPKSSSSSGNESDHTESKHLGRSLITLARVFDALVSQKSTSHAHIPFRDSKLTHLLKPSLTGDAKCVLLITLNMGSQNYEASMRSIRLADKASAIALGRTRKNTAIQGGIRTLI